MALFTSSDVVALFMSRDVVALFMSRDVVALFTSRDVVALCVPMGQHPGAAEWSLRLKSTRTAPLRNRVNRVCVPLVTHH